MVGAVIMWRPFFYIIEKKNSTKIEKYTHMITG